MNHRAPVLLVLLPLLFVALPAFAEGPDELWEMSMKMEMAGMPAMPGHTTQVCKQKGNRDPYTGQQDKNSDCKVTDVKTSGNTTTWKMACTRPEPMTGTGEMTHTGDKFNGVVRMRGKMDGENFDMTQVMSGRKVGSCKYEDPAKQVQRAQAQTQAMIDKECDKHIGELNPALIFGGQGISEEMLICKHRKADYCANATKVTRQMKDEASFEAVSNEHRAWRESLQACGTDPATVSGPVCKSAAGRKNYKFVAENCPTESRALALKHCAGLDYTAAMASEYREICQRHGSVLAKEKVDKPASPSGTTEPKPNATVDAVKEGAKSLKKLLKF